MDPTIKKVHERIKYVEQDENMLHAYRIWLFTTSIPAYTLLKEKVLK
jgi:hypothetical protein